eukprot:TRINITY_DN18196_c0_g1_i1.p1 TRINITY_DN18196_c0_g1~~TRINITY_DN18196_c0_g1_i1.p1  ORF type:complete len:167 (+),score=17.73 TRINITY_DN18196_c0_g1_i1:115-615(+)
MEDARSQTKPKPMMYPYGYYPPPPNAQAPLPPSFGGYMPPPDLPWVAYMPLYCPCCQHKIRKSVRKLAKKGVPLPPLPPWLALHSYVEQYALYHEGLPPRGTTFSISDRSSCDSGYGSLLTHGSSEPYTPVSSKPEARVDRPVTPVPTEPQPFYPISRNHGHDARS